MNLKNLCIFERFTLELLHSWLTSISQLLQTIVKNSIYKYQRPTGSKSKYINMSKFDTSKCLHLKSYRKVMYGRVVRYFKEPPPPIHHFTHGLECPEALVKEIRRYAERNILIFSHISSLPLVLVQYALGLFTRIDRLSC